MSSILAIIPTYNEGDILPWTIHHLLRQGVDVYVVDNWSTDNTEDYVKNLRLVLNPQTTQTLKQRLSYEKFPSKSVDVYQWGRILEHIAGITQESWARDYRWFMLNDADEIRYAPQRWENGEQRRLRLDRYVADISIDYNMVNFKVRNYVPMINTLPWESDINPELYFNHYQKVSSYDKVPHVKMWRNMGTVDLSWTGGHRVIYTSGPHTKQYPIDFLSKHYGIRSQEHGTRKVAERVKRWNLSERGKGWHVQYDGITPGHNFLHNPADANILKDG